MSLTLPKDSREFFPTYVIIALNIIVYAYTSILSGDFIETNYYVILQYGQVNYFVFNGWYWQLFTAMFIHVNIIHLLGNMFFLLIFGLRAEEMFSIKEYLLIYFLSGLAGNLLSLLFGPFAPPSAGASGAIFGMFGACTIYIRRAIGQSIVTALMYAFFLFMISIGPNVNFLAHFGGLAVGLLIGYVLATKRKVRTPYKFRYNFNYSLHHYFHSLLFQMASSMRTLPTRLSAVQPETTNVSLNMGEGGGAIITDIAKPIMPPVNWPISVEKNIIRAPRSLEPL